VAGQTPGAGSTGPPTTPQRLSAAAATALPPDHSLDDDIDHEIFLEQQKREPEGHSLVEMLHGPKTSAEPRLSMPCNMSPGAGALGPPIRDIRLRALHPVSMELAALHPTDTKPDGTGGNRQE